MITRGRQYETDMIHPTPLNGQLAAPEDIDRWMAKYHEANAARRPYMQLHSPATSRRLRWWKQLRLRFTSRRP